MRPSGWGSFMQWGMIPRFHRAVCDYFTLGVPGGEAGGGGEWGTDLDPATPKNFREGSASAVRERSRTKHSRSGPSLSLRCDGAMKRPGHKQRSIHLSLLNGVTAEPRLALG